MFFNCLFKNQNLLDALHVVIKNEHKRYVQIAIIKILRDYAKATTNQIDDELVDEIERRLLHNHALRF